MYITPTAYYGENVTLPSGSVDGIAPPFGVLENVTPLCGSALEITPPSGIGGIIALFSCSALDVTPPLSYAEEIVPPSRFLLAMLRVSLP